MKALIASTKVIDEAMKLVSPDEHMNCVACLHDVDVCDCALAKLRAAVCDYAGVPTGRLAQQASDERGR